MAQGKRKVKMGRPPELGKAREHLVALRFSADELQRARAKARAAGLDLSAWIRKRLED